MHFTVSSVWAAGLEPAQLLWLLVIFRKTQIDRNVKNKPVFMFVCFFILNFKVNWYEPMQPAEHPNLASPGVTKHVSLPKAKQNWQSHKKRTGKLTIYNKKRQIFIKSVKLITCNFRRKISGGSAKLDFKIPKFTRRNWQIYIKKTGKWTKKNLI